MEHKCNQTQRIENMEADIKDLKLVLAGPDGRSGIVKELTLLTQSSTNLIGSVKELTVEVRELRENRIKSEAKDDENSNAENKKRAVRQYVITTIIAVTAIIVTIILKFVH